MPTNRSTRLRQASRILQAGQRRTREPPVTLSSACGRICPTTTSAARAILCLTAVVVRRREKEKRRERARLLSVPPTVAAGLYSNQIENYEISRRRDDHVMQRN